jgi:transposase
MKKRGVSPGSATPPKRQKQTQLSPEVRHIAQVQLFKYKNEGHSKIEVFEYSKSLGYDLSLRTTERYVKNEKEGRSPTSGNHSPGAPSKLSAQQHLILAGGLICLDERGVEITREHVVNLVRDLFDVDIANTTAGKYLQQLGFSRQKLGSRPLPRGINFDNYVVLYYECLMDLRRVKFFQIQPQWICSIDFWTNTRRTEERRAFRKIGSKQRKYSKESLIYTDSYLGCLWRDGINHTPAMLFSFNPDLDVNGRNAGPVREFCRVHSLDTRRIVYQHSTKSYKRENCADLRKFWDLYPRMQRSRILHDKGGAFSKATLAALKCEKEFGYEAIVHGEMSPNDNHFHAIIKNQWRANRTQFEYEWQKSLFLLYLSDHVQPKNIRQMFENNFMLHRIRLNQVSVERMLTRKLSKNIRVDSVAVEQKTAYLDFIRSKNAD